MSVSSGSHATVSKSGRRESEASTAALGPRQDEFSDADTVFDTKPMWKIALRESLIAIWLIIFLIVLIVIQFFVMTAVRDTSVEQDSKFIGADVQHMLVDFVKNKLQVIHAAKYLYGTQQLVAEGQVVHPRYEEVNQTDLSPNPELLQLYEQAIAPYFISDSDLVAIYNAHMPSLQTWKIHHETPEYLATQLRFAGNVTGRGEYFERYERRRPNNASLKSFYLAKWQPNKTYVPTTQGWFQDASAAGMDPSDPLGKAYNGVWSGPEFQGTGVGTATTSYGLDPVMVYSIKVDWVQPGHYSVFKLKILTKTVNTFLQTLDLPDNSDVAIVNEQGLIAGTRGNPETQVIPDEDDPTNAKKARVATINSLPKFAKISLGQLSTVTAKSPKMDIATGISVFSLDDAIEGWRVVIYLDGEVLVEPYHPYVNAMLGFAIALIVLALLSIAWSAFNIKGVMQDAERKEIRVAQKCSELSYRMAECLRKYNTDRVKALLEVAQTDDDYNPALLESFSNLCHNLERYRPYLPNFLFLSTSEDEDEDDEGIIEETTLGGGSSNSADRRSSYTARSQRGKAKVTLSSLVGQNTNFRGWISLAIVELRGSEWFNQQSVREQQNVMNHASLNKATDELFRIALQTKGSIHSTVGDQVQVSWNATARVAQPEGKAVTFLQQLRDAFNVNGMVGMSGACCSGLGEVNSVFSEVNKQQALFIDCQWLPALQACLDLGCRFKTIVLDTNTAFGASMEATTQAIDCVRYKPRVGFNSETGEPTSVLVQGAKSLPQIIHPSVFPTAFRNTSDLLVNGETLSYRTPTAASREENTTNNAPIADSNTRYTCCHELVGLKKYNNDEWMYQLQESQETQKAGPEAAVTQALFRAADRNFSEALALLDSVKDKNGQSLNASALLHLKEPQEQSCESPISMHTPDERISTPRKGQPETSGMFENENNSTFHITPLVRRLVSYCNEKAGTFPKVEQ